jgi:anaerobic selenocysteine-containing dehydrogenase
MGEAKSNLAVFQALAARMGFSGDLFTESLESIILGVLSPEAAAACGVDRAALRDGRPHRIRAPRPGCSDGFPTPSGRLEFYSQGMREAGLDPLPCHTPCHPGSGDDGLLHLIAPPSKHFLNSTFGAVPAMVARAGRPELLIHPDEASHRGISNAELVTVRSPQGEVRLHLRVTTDVPRGVVVAASVWWQKHSPEGKGINHLTSARTTDMAGGSTFHCNLVTVSPA